MKKYRKDLDLLKGIAILAIVFYHIGILKSGYLGVDIFLLINGFFVIPSIYNKMKKDEFKYFDFLKNKYIRLAPLVIIVCVLVMIIGFFGMLPDDYENLSQSVVATLGFSQNILSAITTKDYWNVINEYKPLMHFWYIGILMEFYIVVPLIMYLAKKVSQKYNKEFKNILLKTLLILTTISFILFLMPMFSDGNKFYYLFFRIWELLLGGIIYFIIDSQKNKIKGNKKIKIISLCIIILILLIGIINTNYNTLWEDRIVPIGSKEVYNSNLVLPNNISIIITIAFSAIFISTDECKFNSRVLENIGKMSYSIFVWHQPILALYRYFIKYELPIYIILIYTLIVLILSYGSYIFIEKKIKYNSKILFSCITLTGITGIVAFIIYVNAGVVRNVPELNISKNNIHYKMHAEYVDRIYNYDKEFDINDKINVLIVGNSFARDFANILLESEINESINLSYAFSLNEFYIDRLKKCDFIFYFGYKSNIPKYLWDNIKEYCTVYGIGTKNFGESNGVVYSKRFSENYYNQIIELNNSYKELNNELKNEWGNNYIDLIEPVQNKNGYIRIFTDDNKFISQDCHHLTQAGAKYYSKLINFNSIIKNGRN